MRPGDAWGTPASGEPEVEGSGGDAELAALVRAHPGALVRFLPDAQCDLARAVGLRATSPGGCEVAVDALDLGDMLAVNMLTVGARPDRIRWWTRARHVTVTIDERLLFAGPATSVVVANGQYLAGADVVPRGHPGDGRLEVQVYALNPGERSAMRARLASGTHVPHPRIHGASGRRADVAFASSVPAEADGRPVAARARWRVGVVPGAVRLLV
jgi:hypothetical protein